MPVATSDARREVAPERSEPMESYEAGPTRFSRWLGHGRRVLKLLVVVVLVVVGAGVGAQVGRSQPVVYRSETRLAVGPESFLTQSMPGFTEASQSLASNYARYVEDTAGGISRVSRVLEVDSTTITSIQASPIAGSNVIRVIVAAKDADVADRAAGYLARGLIRRVNSPPPELRALRERLASATAAMARVEARLEDLSRQSKRALALQETAVSARISREQIAAKSDLSLAQATQQAAFDQYKSSLQEGTSQVTLQQIRAPMIVSDSGPRTTQWGGLAGAAAGLVVGFALLFFVYVGARARARRR